jgi:hypothetical protein
MVILRKLGKQDSVNGLSIRLKVRKNGGKETKENNKRKDKNS